MEISGPREATSVATQFLEDLANLDIDGVLDAFHPEAYQEMPFVKSPGHDRVHGKERLTEHYRRIGDHFSSAQFSVTAVWEHSDPGWVTLEYDGRVVSREGRIFSNTYLAMFEVRDGQILRMREFFVPVVPVEDFEKG